MILYMRGWGSWHPETHNIFVTIFRKQSWGRPDKNKSVYRNLFQVRDEEDYRVSFRVQYFLVPSGTTNLSHLSGASIRWSEIFRLSSPQRRSLASSDEWSEPLKNTFLFMCENKEKINQNLALWTAYIHAFVSYWLLHWLFITVPAHASRYHWFLDLGTDRANNNIFPFRTLEYKLFTKSSRDQKQNSLLTAKKKKGQIPKNRTRPWSFM